MAIKLVTWIDICDASQEMPKDDVNTINGVMTAVELALVLWRFTDLGSLQDKRGYLVRMAASLIYGIELLDAEIQDEADASVQI